MRKKTRQSASCLANVDRRFFSTTDFLETVSLCVTQSNIFLTPGGSLSERVGSHGSAEDKHVPTIGRGAEYHRWKRLYGSAVGKLANFSDRTD